MSVSLLRRLRALDVTGMATNTLWNFAGLLTPLLAAVVAIPVIVALLGVPRFGVLTLSWAVVGYFGVFDLGLGRALTQRVASALGEQRLADIPSLIVSGLWMLAGLGLLGSTIAWVLAGEFIRVLGEVPEALAVETRDTIHVLALSIPVVVVATGLRGVLEAYGAFRAVNLVRIPLGIFNYVAPVCVLPFANSLPVVVAVLAVGRVAACVIYAVLCLRQAGGLTAAARFSARQAGSLLGFGTWMTVSNLIGPLMLYMDRFALAGFDSMEAVAYYATPQEIVVRIGFIPGAVMGVLFPAFAIAFVSDPRLIAGYFERAARYLLILVFPVLLILAVFASEILGIWLGPEFALNSTLIMQILVVGIFLNSQARLLNTLIQGEGRADISARVHLCEFVAYAGALFIVIPRFGAIGAACVWSLRVLVDLLALALILRLRGVLGAVAMGRLSLWLLLGVVALAAGAIVQGAAVKASYFVAAIGCYSALSLLFLRSDLSRDIDPEPGRV